MAGAGGETWGTNAGTGGGGCRPPQPARDGPVNPASPANMLRREIIKPGIPCCGFDRSPPELTTHDLGRCENPQLGKAGRGGLDPAYAPGTGTPEIGGYTPHEAQRMLRGLRGLNLIGGDVVEVSPPFDMSGNTALVGVTMMWEILCLLAESVAKRKGRI